jgi:hypothetical protein
MPKVFGYEMRMELLSAHGRIPHPKDPKDPLDPS